MEADQLSCAARYQQLLLDSRLQTGSQGQKADVLRNILSHLQCVELTGKQVEAVNAVQDQYEDMYANIVDSLDEQTGLNNFAEGALALSRGHKNESQKWRSSLSLEKIKSMPSVQQAASRSQKDLLGSKRPSDPLPGRSSNKENRPTVANTNISHQQYSTFPASSVSSNISSRPINKGLGFSSVAGGASVSGAGRPKDRVMSLYGSESDLGRVPVRGQDRADMAGSGRVVRGWLGPKLSGGESNFGREAVGMSERDGGGWGQARPPVNQYQPANRQPLFSSGRASSDNVTGGRNRETAMKRGYGQTDLSDMESEPQQAPTNVFRTAKQQMDIDNARKYGGGQGRGSLNPAAYGTGKKSLGTRRGLNSKFVPPVMNKEDEEFGNEAANTITRAVLKTGGTSGGAGTNSAGANMEGMDDERLKGIEPKMVELIMNEIMDNGPPMTWDDVAGLEFAKKTIKEIVVWPMLRPDIFTGLRGPPKGLLLFGPPGTGKTLIGKCIASQSKSTFFCISASSLTSKWVGEGEKMVRALFAVARARQPAVVFIDEIDSLLTQRTDGENEASRRIKTEFLVQLDGASTSSEDRLLVIGATNRPQEIDEAARRRFVKRLYIPLPELEARQTIITNLLRQQAYTLSSEQLQTICSRTDGFSGADMATLCREAALGPIRDMSFGDIENISADQVRAIMMQDFEEALQHVRPSVSDKDLDVYIDWNSTFGSGGR